MTGKVEVIVGIDEAGRGPVMGPMVYGIAALPITTNETKILEKYGANDSKQLTDEKRRSILAKLKTIPDFYYAAEAVSAEQISFQMNQPNKISLNQIAFLAARKLLEEVHKRYKIVHVYIDLISPA